MVAMRPKCRHRKRAAEPYRRVPRRAPQFCPHRLQRCRVPGSAEHQARSASINNKWGGILAVDFEHSIDAFGSHRIVELPSQQRPIELFCGVLVSGSQLQTWFVFVDMRHARIIALTWADHSVKQRVPEAQTKRQIRKASYVLEAPLAIRCACRMIH